ncbi:hypothetical protein LCGC14_1400850 [marine sediment metagenome]|uniref:Uncharacterized protein n=1 Tax=marine sediment metagenome TaxID=412755 RepID=A0A0F9JXF3_9ZZZZ
MKSRGWTTIEVIIVIAVVMVIGAIAVPNLGGTDSSPTQSSSGVKQASVDVATGSDGLTVEQRNVKTRLTEDNKPGSIKHLYIISAYSGQVLIYSTVKGKVTSSGKRLSPYSVAAADGQQVSSALRGMRVNIGGNQHRTTEVLQDDGTYGSSIPYVFWWDSRDIYHQHYIAGGQILHVSTEPLAVKSVVINMELSSK